MLEQHNKATKPVSTHWLKHVKLFFFFTRAASWGACLHVPEGNRCMCRSKQGKAAKPPKLSRSEREAGEKREQMAAAAEARMARLKLASQQQQLWS